MKEVIRQKLNVQLKINGKESKDVYNNLIFVAWLIRDSGSEISWYFCVIAPSRSGREQQEGFNSACHRTLVHHLYLIPLCFYIYPCHAD